MSGREEDEVLASRAEDIEILRLMEDAQRTGQARRADALHDLARQAEFRQRTALGVWVRRGAA